MPITMKKEMLDGLISDWLAQDLDRWTRRVLHRHFDPDGGSAFWLKQRTELDFDPLEITRYEELSAFDNFDLAVLRDLDPVDLVPASVPRPLAARVFESGGTTGRPGRICYTDPMTLHRAAWHQYGWILTGFRPGATWIDACPSGPHIVGEEKDHLVELWDSMVYAIDLDPRWIKTLIRGSKLGQMQDYVTHILDQIIDVLETRPVDYLRSTPAIVQALVNRRPDLMSRLSGVSLGGTQFTPEGYRRLADAMPGGLIGSTYGNTLGNANGLPSPDGGRTLPYAPSYPHTTMTVVDKDDNTTPVAYGEVGRVRVTILQEDLFLPNVLERDQAIRFDLGVDWPCDGVANVQPLQVSSQMPEGLY
jgi:hypothetical protein